MCRYCTSYTVVGMSHATQLAKAETFANFIDTLVGWVLNICDGQPIYLTGYSFGAISALLIARQLHAIGRTVDALVLIEPPRLAAATLSNVYTPAESAFRRASSLVPSSVSYPRQDSMQATRRSVTFLSEAGELLSDFVLCAPTLWIHAADSQSGVENFFGPPDSDRTVDEQLARNQAVLHYIRSDWRLSEDSCGHLKEVVVTGDHACISEEKHAEQTLRPLLRFFDAAQKSSRAATALGANFLQHSDSDQECNVEHIGAAWYEKDIQWHGVQPQFPWAATVDTAVAVWAAKCGLQNVGKKEVQYALLVIDTVLLWQHVGRVGMNAPDLSEYRAYRATSTRVCHLEPWLYFALLKALEGGDIRAHEARHHFERSNGISQSVYFEPPMLPERQIVGCFELVDVEIFGLTISAGCGAFGRLVHTEEGTMAVVMKLRVGGQILSMSYSGEWHTIGSNVSSHVLHWARCNQGHCEADRIIDIMPRPHNYFGTRVRKLHLSDDAQLLRLSSTNGVCERWARAPPCGWKLAEAPALDTDGLREMLMGDIPHEPARITTESRQCASQLQQAGLAMQALALMYPKTTPASSAS